MNPITTGTFLLTTVKLKPDKDFSVVDLHYYISSLVLLGFWDL